MAWSDKEKAEKERIEKFLEDKRKAEEEYNKKATEKFRDKYGYQKW